MTSTDILFQPLQLGNLTVKNRFFRSNISGRFDNYNGSGNQARINWEVKFARGGVGGIISSFVPVLLQGRIIPNYATIHSDEMIPFWRRLGEAVHAHDCKFIMQLSHSGRQRDIPGVEYPVELSSTSRSEPLHGFPCQAMTIQDIADTVAAFAQGARRAREAGLDGVELHSANGYLFTQFLSSGINDRHDAYGGSLENRARFLLDVVRAIRAEVGRDFHLQAKISATDYNNAMLPWEGPGNTIEDSVQVARWLEQAGVDAIHVSTGSTFPHPKNPAGQLPVNVLSHTYEVVSSSGAHTLRNYLAFRTWPFSALFEWWWEHNRGNVIEGLNLPDSRAIKRAVSIPVICTGGFQTASFIRAAIQRGDCDAVSMARPLVANNDLPHMFARGLDRAPRPCTYCNKCLANVLENPLGCYDETRFDSREDMLREIMSVYEPPPFASSSQQAGQNGSPQLNAQPTAQTTAANAT
ncbi:MAG: NADH:flavin oxidoreductase [Chloroflexi bacterium]|nr:NADH:flavin oxidoreductase [Chloroflexota bacterium]